MGILGHSFAEPQLPPTRCSFGESSIEAAEMAMGSNEEAMTDALCDMWSGFTDGSLQKHGYAARRRRLADHGIRDGERGATIPLPSHLQSQVRLEGVQHGLVVR